MGMLREIFMDNSLDGEALPRNIFWVAARNPYQLNSPNAPSVNYTGLVDSNLGTLSHPYLLCPPPPTEKGKEKKNFN